MAKAPATKPKSTAVSKPSAAGGAMVLIQDQLPDYIKTEGARGSENVGTADIIIPRLEVIQALSPAVKKSDPGYIDGAEVGQLNNSVTRELYGDKVFVVPVFYLMQWLVWKERKDKAGKAQDGGFFGAFGTPEEAEERRKKEDPDGKLNVVVIDTPQHFCLLLNMESGKVEEIMVPMPRTKAKISRQWNSLIRNTGGDRFGRVYELGTAEENKNGNDYVNFTVAARGFPNKAIYTLAEETYKKIAAQERKVVMDVTGMGGDEESASGNNKM